MSAWQRFVGAFLLAWYVLLLRLYPRRFREQFEEEMAGVFAEAVDAARGGGRFALTRLVLRELRTYPGCLLLAYGQSWRQLEPLPVDAPSWPWIGGWTVLSVGLLPLAYLMAAPLGILFVLLLELFPGAPADPSIGSTLGGMIAVGLATGVVQWLLLRRRILGAGWWIPLTVAGWLAGGGLVFLLFTTLVDGSASPPGPGLAFLALAGCVGLAQWLLLRRVVRGAGWWLAASLLAGGAVFLAGETFESIAEMVGFLILPYLLTGAVLWLLLQRGPTAASEGGDAGLRLPPRKAPSPRSGRARLLLAFLLLLALLGAGPWVYAVSHLELAKQHGVYASPEAAIRARAEAVEGVEVEEIQMVGAGPNAHDGSLPHVWFARAYVRFAPPRRDDGRQWESWGSFYIRVENGWVHVGEGAFPSLIGRIMEIYSLEGVGERVGNPGG